MADGNVDLTTLGLVVQFGTVDEAKQALRDFSQEGRNAEKAADGVAQANKRLAQEGKASASASLGAASAAQQMAEQIRATEAAMRSATPATQRLAQEGQRATKTFADFYDVASRDFSAQWAAGAERFVASHGKVQNASRLTADQMRNLSFQLNDVVTGFASGQDPMRIFAQQGGQVYQALQVGPGGVGGSLKALGGLLTGTTGTLLIAGGAFVGLTVAALGFAAAIDKEQERFGKLEALARGVGAASGLSAQGIEAAAQAGARAGDISVAAAESMATSYAQTGQVGAAILTQLIAHTEDYSKATGEDAKQASKELAAAMADPAKGAEELNAKFGILNATQLEHIKYLAESGQKQQAQGELLRALEPVWDDQAKHVGGLVGTLKDVVTWAQNAGHALVQAASGDTRDLATKIFELQQQSATAKAAGGASARFAQSVTDPQIAALQAQLRAANDRTTQATQNAHSTAAGAVYSAVTPGAGDLDHLNGQLAVVNTRITELKASGHATGEEWNRLTDSQERLTHAVTTWVTPAQKAHDVAVAQAEAARAQTTAAKSLAAQHLAAAQAEGEAVTATELHTRATDAASIAADRFNAAHKNEPIKDRITALEAEIAGNRNVAAAYDLSTAAGLRAQASSKALADAAKTKGQATQFERLELEALVTATSVEAAKSIDAAKGKNAAQAEVNRIMREQGLSTQEATRQVADHLEIAKLEAAAANATGKDLDQLNRRIEERKRQQREANVIDQQAVLISEARAASNQLAQLELEATLIGSSNRERTIRLSLLKEEQSLQARGVDPSSREGLSATLDALAVAKQTADNTEAQAQYNSQLHAAADLWGDIANEVRNATASFGDYFGTFGKGMSEVLGALADEAKTLEDLKVRWIEAQKAGNTVEMAKLDRQAADVRIRAYGDTAGAAADMFGQQTAAYKVLHAAEQAFRIYQLAMQAKAVVGYFAEAAAHTTTTGVQIANDAVSTTSSVAASTTKGAASAAAGAAKMFEDLGPLGFVAVAAMTAVLAGFALSAGRGGGGAIPGANDFKDRQTAQGAGTVLGDATAKSESIQRSLDLIASNTNTDLEYSNTMVSALRSIDQNIGSLTATLARSLGVGGQLDTSSLGLGTTTSGPGLLTRLFSPISNLLPGLFGSKSTTTLQDQGLQFGSQSIGDIVNQGIQGSIYQQTATETKKKFLGITYSDKTSQNTSTSALDQQLAADMTRVIDSLRTGVLAAASVLGVDGAQATLDAFQLNLGTISLKDLKGQDLTDAINAVFSKAADEMAAGVLPVVSEFQKAGEGAFETLTRLARDYQVVDVAMQAIGKTFGAVGMASIAARERLVGLFDSLDDFTSKTSFFAGHFLTAAEQLAPVQAAVAAEMARLGYAGVTTRDQFKNLVLGIDVATDSGAQLFAALLNVAPAFDKVATAAEDAAKTAAAAADAAKKAANQALADRLTAANDAVSTARSDLTSAYQAEASALQSTISKFQGFADALAQFDNQLATSAALSPQLQYGAAKGQFDRLAALPAGDEGRLQGLQAASQAFIAASKSASPDQLAYARDLAAVRRAVSASEVAAKEQVDTATAQLNALNASVSTLITINQSVLSVRAAIGAFGQAMTVQAAAQAAVGGTAKTSNDNVDVATYLRDNPDLQKNWDKGGSLHQMGATLEQAALQHYLVTGQYEISAGLRKFATGGSFTVGGPTQGDRVPVSFMANGGEHVNISRADSMAGMLAELQALRAELAGLRSDQAGLARDTKKTADTLVRVTRDGDVMLTRAG